MSLSLTNGQTMAKIIKGDLKGKVIYRITGVNTPANSYNIIKLGKNKLSPVIDIDARQVSYIAGYAGSGKSYYSSALAMSFKRVFPKRDIYFFSRTPWEDDKAYKKLKPIQVDIMSVLGENPIESEDIEPGSLVIFDDVNTILDKRD